LDEPEEAAKIKLPSDESVHLRLEDWWTTIEPFVFFRNGIHSPSSGGPDCSLDPLAIEGDKEVLEPSWGVNT